MKFDDLLAQYLYENKILQLQGIGTFNLDNAVVLPLPQDKEVYYPIEGLHFTYAPKEQTNEDLILFLVKRLGKIQPLVRSDLESYLSNIKQFINIGKPYTIEGVGTLHKNNNGVYEFTPGNFLPVKEELRPHRENADQAARQKIRSGDSRRTASIIGVILLIVVLIGGAIWGVMVLMSHNNNSALQEVNPDTINQNVARAPDTLAVQNSMPTAVTEELSDTALYQFKMIFDNTKSKERIFNRSAILKKDGIRFKIDTLTVDDTLRYRMYIPKTIRLSDTARVRDSLTRFFNKRIEVERKM